MKLVTQDLKSLAGVPFGLAEAPLNEKIQIISDTNLKSRDQIKLIKILANNRLSKFDITIIGRWFYARKKIQKFRSFYGINSEIWFLDE